MNVGYGIFIAICFEVFFVKINPTLISMEGYVDIVISRSSLNIYNFKTNVSTMQSYTLQLPPKEIACTRFNLKKTLGHTSHIQRRWWRCWWADALCLHNEMQSKMENI